MKTSATVLLLSLITLSFMASAMTPQQEKMKICKSDPLAQKRKGEALRGFIQECMAEPLEAELTPQQKKTKACNQRATDQGLRGDNRQGFIAKCLSEK